MRERIKVINKKREKGETISKKINNKNKQTLIMIHIFTNLPFIVAKNNFSNCQPGKPSFGCVYI